MSSKRLDSIADFHRQGYLLRVDCRQCGRVAVLDPLALLERCRAKGWSYQLAVIEGRFRCGKCGARRARLGPAFRDT